MKIVLEDLNKVHPDLKFINKSYEENFTFLDLKIKHKSGKIGNTFITLHHIRITQSDRYYFVRVYGLVVYVPNQRILESTLQK